MRTGSWTGPPRGGKGAKGRNYLDCIRGKGVRHGLRSRMEQVATPALRLSSMRRAEEEAKLAELEAEKAAKQAEVRRPPYLTQRVFTAVLTQSVFPPYLTQSVFTAKNEFPHKSVNLFFILAIVKDKSLTYLWGS